MGPLAAESPEAKQELTDQLRREVGKPTGMFNLISQYLPGGDIAKAIEQMPQFWGGTAKAGAQP